MGRNAHLLRLALGRNADQAPDWDSLSDQYELVVDEGFAAPTYRGIDPTNPVTYGQLFNEKGRPINPAARHADNDRVESRNAVIKIALDNGASSPQPPAAPPKDGFEDPDSVLGDASPVYPLMNQIQVKRVNRIFYRSMLLDVIASSWIKNLRRRILLLRSLNDGPFVNILVSDYTKFGFWSLLFGGAPVALLNTVLIQGFGGWYYEYLAKRFFPLSTRSAITSLLINSTHAVVFGAVDILLSVYAQLQNLHLVSVLDPSLMAQDLRNLPSWTLNDALNCIIPAYLLLTISRQTIQLFRALIRNTLLISWLQPEDPKVADRQASVDSKILAEEIRLSGGASALRTRPFLSLRHSLPSMWTFWVKRFQTPMQALRRAFRLNEVTKLSAPREYVHMEQRARFPLRWASESLAALLADLSALIVTTVTTRAFVQCLTGPSPSTSRFPNAETLALDIIPAWPLFDDMSSLVGVRSSARFAAQLAFTFGLQAAASVFVVGLKSAYMFRILGARKSEEKSIQSRPQLQTADERQWEDVQGNEDERLVDLVEILELDTEDEDEDEEAILELEDTPSSVDDEDGGIDEEDALRIHDEIYGDEEWPNVQEANEAFYRWFRAELRQ